MIRDRLIHLLGGRTQKEYLQCLNQLAFETNVVKDLRETIRNLSALIPVSAVTSKKRGRPRKKVGGEIQKNGERWTYTAKASEDWQKDMM